MADGAAVLNLPHLLLGISAPNTPNAGDGSANLTLPSLQLQAAGISEADLTLPRYSINVKAVSGSVTNVTQHALLLGTYQFGGTGLTGSLASASIALPVFNVAAHSVSAGAVLLPVLRGNASGATGAAGSSAATVPSLRLNAAGRVENLAQLNRTLGALVLLAEGDSGSVASLVQTLRNWTVAANGSGGAAGRAALTLPHYTAAAVGYGPSIGSASLTLPMLQLLVAGHGPAAAASAYTTLAFNANTAGLTNYTNFPFNSMANFGGVSLAAGDNGIYALGGTLDDTVVIDPKVRLGIFDFNSDKLKRIDAIFFGYRADGELTVRVTTEDSDEYEYTLESTGQSGIYTNRLKLGKGVKARYWQFEIEGPGVNFQLDSLDPQPQELSRHL